MFLHPQSYTLPRNVAPALRRAFQITSINGTFRWLHPAVRRYIILTFCVPANIRSVHALKIETDELVQISRLIVDFEVGDVPAEKTMSAPLIF